MRQVSTFWLDGEGFLAGSALTAARRRRAFGGALSAARLRRAYSALTAARLRRAYTKLLTATMGCYEGSAANTEVKTDGINFDEFCSGCYALDQPAWWLIKLLLDQPAWWFWLFCSGCYE